MNYLNAITSFPDVAQTLFQEVADAQLNKGSSETTANKVAMSVMMNRFELKDEQYVARSDAFVETKYYTFNAEPAEQLVSRSEDGHLIHTYILSDVNPDLEGKAPTEGLLKKFADFINRATPEVDSDHELFNTMNELHGGDIQAVSRAMSFKKGIAKMVNAVVDAGKLVVSVLFDKRFEKHADKVKGMSLEGAFKFNQITKQWTDGTPLGATFAMNGEPYNPRSVRVA